MSHQQRDRLLESLASDHGGELVDVKFFRGLRNDVITAEEISGQAHSAFMQHRLKTADVSKEAPKSTHPMVDVREFVASL